MCQGVHGDECGGNIRFVNIRSANVNDRYFTGHGSLGYNEGTEGELRYGIRKEDLSILEEESHVEEENKAAGGSGEGVRRGDLIWQKIQI
jgi:hypothetical protein